MFRVAELFIILLFLWLVANLVRYCFCKTTTGGWIFGLSNMWIKERVSKEEVDEPTTTKTRTRKGKA